jgi:NAD(P)-dependent dehydrogenase (short-subunit alcohol dehydrogenase family)
MTFTNRVILITGAGSGLGRQLALTLAGEGAHIAAIDLQPEPLESLAGQLAGKKVAWAIGDVTRRDTLLPTVARLQEELGPIDLLIANAGIGRETSAVAFRGEDVEAQIMVNLVGVANSIEVVLPGMIQRRSGHLVAISSLASYRGLPKMAGYCASKAGLNALLEALRLELREHNVLVTTICPGWIRTPLTQSVDVPQPYLMEVDVAARRIVEAIRRRRLFYAFPPPGAWQLRLLRWLPAGLSDWVAEQAHRQLLKQYPPRRAAEGQSLPPSA